MARREKSLLRFDAVRVEGAIIQPDLIETIANGKAEGQSEENYGLVRGLNLRDEIGRAFIIAKGQWQSYQDGIDGPNPGAVRRRLASGIMTHVLGFELGAKRGYPARSRTNADIDLYLLAGGRVPVAIGAGNDVDHVETLDIAGAGPIRRSATTLIQGDLNARDGAFWGIATNGLTWRLLRDNESITRPGYIEIDLARIFRDDLYSDFTAFWLLAHRSRFPQDKAAGSDCSLERWRQLGREQGVTARSKLRDGVQKALFHFGRGFLENPANAALVARLNADGDARLTKEDLFRQLLRMVYRLIFVMTAEDRDILHPADAHDAAKAAYDGGYATGRLRERARDKIAWDRHHDAFEGIKALFRALRHGEPRLGLPALGGLFAMEQTPDLDGARLTNKRFLQGFYNLAWLRRSKALSRINWRDMETEEFGSVYESLLELTPDLTDGGRRFSFVGQPDEDKVEALAAGKNAKGNERKTTGSYYTPDSLVQLLLKEALDPVIERKAAENPNDPEALLTLKVIDPACGSGHFILAAARKIARKLADLRYAGSPTVAQYRHALRDVARHCIYGVDRNRMAVELCKVAIWIETVEPGKPLTFMDQKIRCGDSLLGVFDFDMLRRGLPDEAFEPLTGDDKDVAKAYAAINKEQRDGVAASGLIDELRMPAEIESGAENLRGMPEDTVAQVGAKQEAFRKLTSGKDWRRLKVASDMYVAAFLYPKRGEAPDPRQPSGLPVPTTEAIWHTVRGGDARREVEANAVDLATASAAFHWPLEFPEVMSGGGFNVVFGNPPWERIKLQEQEFFESRDADIAAAANKADRDRLIKALKGTEPGSPTARLSEEFESAKRAAEAASVFARKSGRFPLTGTGDVNTYALFCEHFLRLAREDGGRAGVLAPTGIATDSTTSPFFGHLVANRRLAALYDFENRLGLFPAVDSRVKFSILVMGPTPQAQFAAYLRDPFEVGDNRRQIEMKPKDFRLFNPNTLTAPLFRAVADRNLTHKIYRAAPVLLEERPGNLLGDVNPWGFFYQTKMYDLADASPFFKTARQMLALNLHRDGPDWVGGGKERYVPLYEAKMIHHFDHRFGSYSDLCERPGDGVLPETPDTLMASPGYEPDPWYWVPATETELRAARVPARLKASFRKNSSEACLKVLSEWIVGSLDPDDFAKPALAVKRAEALLRDVCPRALTSGAVGPRIASWFNKIAGSARAMQRETPINGDDLEFIRSGPTDGFALTAALIERKQPRWLIGWRDICRSNDERTVIAGVFPKVGVAHSIRLMFLNCTQISPAILYGLLSSLPFDYVSRQKISGTHLTVSAIQQLPVLEPRSFMRDDVQFIISRVLELTYTSNSLRSWAEDLGHVGQPFRFDPARRAVLRAELDAFFARKYGLTRDELRYVLDPESVEGAGYPSETFRGLKAKEMAQHNEYRTARLVIEAFDNQTAGQQAA